MQRHLTAKPNRFAVFLCLCSPERFGPTILNGSEVPHGNKGEAGRDPRTSGGSGEKEVIDKWHKEP